MKHILGFLNTSPLWHKEQFGLQQFEFPKIDISSFKTQPIPTNLRLGHQVEYIFKQLVEHSGLYKVRAHNIQIKKGKITISELDFILEENRFHQSKTKPLLHVELTYKFYIIDPKISEPIHRLMGPNRKDMFFTKVEKTRHQQMPLALSTEGKKALNTCNIQAQELVQQTCFLGQLFVPYQQKIPSIRPLNTQCICGFWISFDAFNTSIFKPYRYYIPFKYEWIHQPHKDVPWQDHFHTLLDINVRHIDQRSPMVWIQKNDKTYEKCFVVWW